MRNIYATLASIRSQLSAGEQTDSLLLDLLASISESVELHCHRSFATVTATRVYDGSGCVALNLPDDLLSVTTLTVDANYDGSYEMTLAANTDYWLYPDNSSPKYAIDLSPFGTQLRYWPRQRRSVQIAGTWGYSAMSEATGATVDTAINDSITTLILSANHGVSVGEILLIESEQVYVASLTPPGANQNSFTVERGCNGTTAAAHSQGVAVSRRRYPPTVEQAVRMQAARLFKRRETAFSNVVANTDLGSFQVFRGLDPDIEHLLSPHVRPVVGGAR